MPLPSAEIAHAAKKPLECLNRRYGTLTRTFGSIAVDITGLFAATCASEGHLMRAWLGQDPACVAPLAQPLASPLERHTTDRALLVNRELLVGIELLVLELALTRRDPKNIVEDFADLTVLLLAVLQVVSTSPDGSAACWRRPVARLSLVFANIIADWGSLAR